MPEIIACIYHINNAEAKHAMGNVQEFVQQMLCECCRYQADVLGGDGNAASYAFVNEQEIPDPTNSMLHRLVRIMVKTYNTGEPNHKRISALAENSTPYELALDFADLDCMDLFVFSWGKTAQSALARRNMEKEIEQEMDSIYGPFDFRMVGSERAKRLTEFDMWLRSRDVSWHRPLFCTLRECGMSNKRKRSAAAQAARNARWAAVQNKNKGTKGAKGSKSRGSSTWNSDDRSRGSSWRDETWHSNDRSRGSDWSETAWRPRSTNTWSWHSSNSWKGQDRSKSRDRSQSRNRDNAGWWQ